MDFSNALSNALSSQRSSEDSDLLERSTRKRKVDNGTSKNAMPVPVENQPLDDNVVNPSSATVESGTSTPVVDPTDSAMQIAGAGDEQQSAGADPGSGTSLPPPTATAMPRSYLDSVVAAVGDGVVEIGATAEVEDQAAGLPSTTNPAAGARGGTAAAGKSKPYGSWMLVTRKEYRPSGRSAGSGKQPETGSRNASAGGATPTQNASGSRFAPLEEDAGMARQPSRARRANVIVNERQIENERATARSMPRTGTDQVPRQPSRGSGSRRAAEEDEHVVIRGELGGQVINSTRVTHEDGPTANNEESGAHPLEHHTDPPDDFDTEGDVVMEIEDPNGESLKEGGVATTSV
nr:uncharacterized protein LOC109156749 [Ipomoea batatas]